MSQVEEQFSEAVKVLICNYYSNDMNNSSFRFRFLVIFSCSKICMVFLCIQQSIEAISDKNWGLSVVKSHSG